MIADLIVLAAVAVGLGGLFPTPFSTDALATGYRAFVGFCALVGLLFFTVTLGGLGIAGGVYTCLALAGMGLVRLVILCRRERPGLVHFAHPFPVLLFLIVAVGAMRGQVDFLPTGFDDFANWLLPAKAMWLVDDYWQPDLWGGGFGYNPGWQLLMAANAPLRGTFDEGWVIWPAVVLHVALLGLVFDVTMNWWRTQFDGGEWAGRIGVAGALILLVAIEASWVLVPDQILVEGPLFHTIIGMFALALVYWLDPGRAWPVTVALSVALCAHYVIKNSGTTAVPVVFALAVVAAITAASERANAWRAAIRHGVAVVAPVLAAMATWSMAPKFSNKCINDPGEMLSNTGRLAELESTLGFGADLIGQSMGYLAGFKTPLLVVSLCGVAVGLLERRLRWPAIGVVAYVGVYLAGLFAAYYFCAPDFQAHFSSLQRYLQVPARLLHLMGPWLLGLYVVMRWPEISRFAQRRHSIVAILSLTILLTAYQANVVDAVMARLPGGSKPGPVQAFTTEVPDDVHRIRRLAEKHGLQNPKVWMTFTYFSELPYLMALFAEIPTRDAHRLTSATVTRFSLLHSYSTRAELPNPDQGRTGLSRELLLAQDILWPLADLPWVRKAIAGVSDNAECLEHPSRHLFLRRPGPGTPMFECVSKSAIDDD